MQAPVAIFLLLPDIILLLQDQNVCLPLDPFQYMIYIFFKIADDPNPCNIRQIFPCFLCAHSAALSAQLFFDTFLLFDSFLHMMDRIILVFTPVIVIQAVQPRHQVCHGILIRNDKTVIIRFLYILHVLLPFPSIVQHLPAARSLLFIFYILPDIFE